MKSALFRKYCATSRFFYNCRKCHTKVRILADMPSSLLNKIEESTLKPKHHPGIVKSPLRSLPPELKRSILQIVGDTPIKQLLNDGKRFNSYLLMRHVPLEENEVLEKKLAISKEIESSINIKKEGASEEELKHYNQVVNSKVNRILKQRIYNWQSVNYTHYMSLVYLISRATPEFIALTRVFQELKRSDPTFHPKSLFDFGSGTGTVIWAAESIWNRTIDEYFCVDTSSYMNDLSSEIIEKSGYNLNSKIFRRQFFPASYEQTYDIVVSAYSLFELPSLSARLQTLHNLWNKTSKYLILVERGSQACFKIINEARDFILMNSRDEKLNIHHAHIVAPCPHEFACPRIQADNTPCNFNIQFSEMYHKDTSAEELFTYIIFAKGKRSEHDKQWPRIVRPVLLRSRHAVCKLCTNNGRLEQITFSPTKPNKMTYRCAKASKWGDLLPVDIKYVMKKDEAS